MNFTAKVLTGVGAAVLIATAAYAIFFRSPAIPSADVPLPESADSLFLDTTASRAALPAGSTATTSASGKKQLPPEPVFVLPPEAIAVDDYAFLFEGRAYFRSLTSTSSLAIPDSDADTFKRIADFVTYPGEAILKECGTAGTYTYYEDRNRVYFYQFWRAPKFRSSKVEVLADVAPEDFIVDDVGSASASDRRVVVNYEVATSTCWYVLIRT